MSPGGHLSTRTRNDTPRISTSSLPLGAVAWAAVEKSPGFTPEGLIAEIRRNSRYSAEAWKAVESTVPIDPIDVKQRLRHILDEAEQFVSQMPSDKAGLLFLKSGAVVQPDPNRLDAYQTHAGKRRGHWPSSPEIATAMFERQTNKPSGT